MSKRRNVHEGKQRPKWVYVLEDDVGKSPLFKFESNGKRWYLGYSRKPKFKAGLHQVRELLTNQGWALYRYLATEWVRGEVACHFVKDTCICREFVDPREIGVS